MRLWGLSLLKTDNPMTAITKKQRLLLKPTRKAVPPALVYEVWNGVPVYYKGYRDVLAGRKKTADIMSCSDLQGAVVYAIGLFIGNRIDRKKWLISTNESGLHLALNDNLGNDIAIYDKAQVGKLTGKFFSVPPRVVIEVDIKADLSEFDNKDLSYITGKAQKMLDFGVEKVVWILTGNRKIYVATRHQKQAIFTDWDDEITLLDGCILNVKRLLDEEEIEY
jgi:hypothetical protein